LSTENAPWSYKPTSSKCCFYTGIIKNTPDMFNTVYLLTVPMFIYMRILLAHRTWWFHSSILTSCLKNYRFYSRWTERL
jgi:hypothetical protein